MEIQEIINRCHAFECVIKLPQITLERNDYLRVKKIMESNGAKWKGGKIGGFVCPNATDVLERLQSGDLSDRKKAYQFFETPVEIGETMAMRLCDFQPGMTVLEPSAGCGALITAFRNIYGDDISIDYCELMPENRDVLKKKFGECGFVGEDFLSVDGIIGKYDRIIANPPFNKNQDIKHIRHMYDCLKEDGRMVSLCGCHFRFASDKDSVGFREWLDEVHATVIDLPEKAFHNSGTDINVVMIVIYKD